MKSLKDFQRASANRIMRRMYLDKKPTKRFLLADEVGLGKTHVVRGVIAKCINHLLDVGIDRVDVVYICSNADIARQNITKINVLDRDDCVLPSRLTLLPKHVKHLKKNSVNFIAFTPGTSFDLRSNLGLAEERVMLYWLLYSAWRLEGKGAAATNLFQGASSKKSFLNSIRIFERKNIDRDIKQDFNRELRRFDKERRDNNQTALFDEFRNLLPGFKYNKPTSSIPEDIRVRRNRLVGDLRRILADSCIKALEPDLVIMDEFQKFKHLLEDGEDSASQLARKLFNYEDVRVLLVSATPYKMYTVGDESDEDDHYQDFMRTIQFLMDDADKSAKFADLIEQFRQQLLDLGGDSTQQLQETKSQLEKQLLKLQETKSQMEKQLCQVMVRTERLGASTDRNGMLEEKPNQQLSLNVDDLAGFVSLQNVASYLGTRNIVEYWKSAPYLLNFMDDYQIKRQFNRLKQEPSLASCLQENRAALLSWSQIQNYQALPSNNSRLRRLMSSTVDVGTWQMLWIAPSHPYYQLQGAYADPDIQKFTKQLIFSAWRVVPKTLASLLSYEAERQIFLSHEQKPLNTPQARKKRRGLLRFARSKGRLTGMPVLGMLYPSPALARLGNPRRITGELSQNGTGPDLQQVLDHVGSRIESELAKLTYNEQETAIADETWYWAAPIMLDLLEDNEASRAWWHKDNSGYDTTVSSDNDRDSRFFQHTLNAYNTIIWPDLPKLGRKPDDLGEVLAWMAVAGPGACCLRALQTISTDGKSPQNPLRNAAISMAWSLRNLFNLPESMAIIRGGETGEPYWQRVLKYCGDGCLQAVLDEYLHMVVEQNGLVEKPDEVKYRRIAEIFNDVVGMRVSTLGVDEIRPLRSRKEVEVKDRTMRARYAMRFGDDKSEDEQRVQRTGTIRQAFNSPFWPFVLVTTSIGQEGLDFHTYCHSIMHWNLPSNPVDFEQREGRIHRYKGHAIRKNVALRHAGDIAPDAPDDWQAMFQAAEKERASTDNDLIPYWIYPVEGGFKIERHVPVLPMSREIEQLSALRNSLAIYRMVFGQPRQDDLLEYLQDKIPADNLAEYMERLRIDLSPK
jgi:hypothetical protein